MRSDVFKKLYPAAYRVLMCLERKLAGNIPYMFVRGDSKEEAHWKKRRPDIWPIYQEWLMYDKMFDEVVEK